MPASAEYADAVLSRTATFNGLRQRGFILREANQGHILFSTMAHKTVDIKIQFEQFDMTPGPAGRVFRRNLLAHGGQPDERGYSIADTLLRVDEGAVVGSQTAAIAAGIAAGGLAVGHVPPALQAPGAPLMPAPGGNAFLQGIHEKAVNARRARVKKAATYINAHVSDAITNDRIGDDTGPLFQDGPEIFDSIMAQVIVPLQESEIEDLRVAWHLLQMISDVGIDANSIKSAYKLLMHKNSEFPAGQRFTADQIAVKLLTMIKNSSTLFSSMAQIEIDSVDGAPGAPDTRFARIGRMLTNAVSR